MPNHGRDAATPASDAADPPRKRQRILSKACEMCKTKKSRCDSARPCSACRQKGVECVYREKGQPGLRPGYGKAMEARMTLLEDNMQTISQSVQEVLQLVQQQQQRSQLPASGGGTPNTGTTAAALAANAAVSLPGTGPAPSPPTTRSTTDVPQHPPSLWQPSPAPNQPQHQQHHQPLGHAGAFPTTPAMGEWLPLPMAAPVPPQSSSSSSSLSLSSSSSSPPVSSSLSHPPGPGLPPREVLLELVELFFERVYPWAPLFYKPNFCSGLFLPERQVLLHAITVLSFRFAEEGNASDAAAAAAREAYIHAAREQVLLRTIDTCSLISTQALTLLALDAVGQGPGPRTWNIMAMLVAAARQLCLATPRPAHRGGDEANTPVVNDDEQADELGPGAADPKDLSSIEAEEKRRLFWVIYSLDRFASIFHGQPGAIDTKTIRLLYPAGDAEWGQTSAAPEWFQAGIKAGMGMGMSMGINGGGMGGMGNFTSNFGNAGALHGHCAANLWHHYIDVLTLVDRSHRLLIQPVNVSMPAHCQEWQSSFRRLDVTLLSWFESLPASVRQPPAAFDPVWTMIHATFLLINIRMYTIAAFPATTSPYLRPSIAARSRLRQAGHDLAALVASHQPHELELLGPLFVFIVWVGARSLTILWTRNSNNNNSSSGNHNNGYNSYGYDDPYAMLSSSTVHGAVRPSADTTSGNTAGTGAAADGITSSSTSAPAMPPDLEPLLTGLRHTAARWPCAQRYVDIVQLILDTKNSPGGPPGLEIFTDPRRTTYVVQSRFQALAGRRALLADHHRHHDYRHDYRHEYHHDYHHDHHPHDYAAAASSYPQSLDFFDMPLLDACDLAGPLIGTGTFGTEIDGEWL